MVPAGLLAPAGGERRAALLRSALERVRDTRHAAARRVPELGGNDVAAVVDHMLSRNPLNSHPQKWTTQRRSRA
jgi:DNA-binding ferritin-like protein (Dps family)